MLVQVPNKGTTETQVETTKTRHRQNFQVFLQLGEKARSEVLGNCDTRKRIEAYIQKTQQKWHFQVLYLLQGRVDYMEMAS